MQNTSQNNQARHDVETLEPALLHDAEQFEYLANEAARHSILYDEPMAVLRVRVDNADANPAMLLRKPLRETDILAHMGDGTFAVLLPCTGFLEATLVAEKLRARRPMSIGVACSDTGAHDVASRSESAMRKAEVRGGDRVCF